MRFKILLAVLLSLLIFEVDTFPSEPGNNNAFTKVDEPLIYKDSKRLAKAASAQFVVQYSSDFPANAQSAFSKACNIWSYLIVTNQTIIVKATWKSLNKPDVLAQCLNNAYYNIPTAQSGNPLQPGYQYTIPLAEALTSQNLNGNNPDIEIEVNSDFKDQFSYSLEGEVVVDKFDFISLIMHEMGHGLGIMSSMNYNPTSGVGSYGMSQFPTDLNGNYPIIYDNNLVQSFALETFRSGNKLLNTINFPINSGELGNAFKSDKIYFDGDKSYLQNGNKIIKLYSPLQWKDGSSISHLDENTFPAGNSNSLMTYALDKAEVIHSPGEVGLAILADLGWQTNRLITFISPTAGEVLKNGQSITIKWMDNSTSALFIDLYKKDNLDGKYYKYVTLSTFSSQLGENSYSCTIPSGYPEASYKIVLIDNNNGLGYGESLSFTITNKIPLVRPDIIPRSGEFTTKDAINVRIQTNDTDARIYYTTDGITEPSESSTLYNPSIGFSVVPPTVIQARTFKDNYYPSEVAKVTYTYVPNAILVTQIDESGATLASTCSMYVWTGSNWRDFIAPQAWLKSPTMYFKAFEGVVSGTTERFNIWKDNLNRNYSRNYGGFNTSDMSKLTAHMASSYNAFIQNAIEGVPTSSASQIYFKDPWKKDENTSLGLRNKGITAEPLIYNSPLIFSNSAGNYGIFKNMTVYTSGVTYSVKALQYQLIDNKPCSFQNWFATGVELSSSTSLESQVVFLQDNAKVYANYKGHLMSSSASATTGNNARKVAIDQQGVSYAVYTSMGSIWFTKKGALDQDWSAEVKIDDGANPSIAVTKDNYIHLVYENGVSGSRVVHYRRSTDGGTTWVNLINSPAIQSTNPATPIVFGHKYPVVVWRGADGLYMSLNPPYHGTSFLQTRVESTDAGSQSPAGDENDEYEYHLVYSRMGDIYYYRFDVSYQFLYPTNVITPKVISQAGGNNINPSVFVSAFDFISAVWENISSRSIYYSETINGGGTWSSAINFLHGSHLLSKPSISASNEYPDELIVVFQCDNHVGMTHKARNTTGSWSGVLNLGQGSEPVISCESSQDIAPTIIYAEGTAAPYNLRLSPCNILSTQTLQQDMTLNGSYIVTGNITVPVNKTLTIAAGSNIILQNSSSLTISGTLNIQGTSSSPVVLDFTARSTSPINSIWANANSTIIMNYTEVKNACSAVWGTDALVQIDHCTLNNLLLPIYLYNTVNNSNGSYIKNSYINNASSCAVWLRGIQALVENNKINNNADIGLRLTSNCVATLSRNTIQNNLNYGISIADYSTSNLTGYNLVTDNRFSTINLYSFSSITTYQGLNSFQIPTGYHVYANWYCNGMLRSNHWGNTPYPPTSTMFYADATSSLDYTYPLDSNPAAGSNLPKETTDKSDDLLLAYDNMTSGNYSEAENLFKKVISRKKNDNEVSYALSGLAANYIKSGKDGFKKYLIEEIKPVYKDMKDGISRQYLDLYSYCLTQEGSYDEALENMKYERENYKLDSFSLRELRFKEAVIHLVFKNDAEKAKSIFNSIKTEFPEKSSSLEIDMLLAAYENGAFENTKNVERKHSSEKGMGSIEDKPVNFGLEQNYPNPFNPVTAIKYSLPENSHVVLEVYNMLGEKTAVMVNEVKSAGYHETMFDGSNLSSGIYIYRITATSLETGRQFVKSAKMLLLK